LTDASSTSTSRFGHCSLGGLVSHTVIRVENLMKPPMIVRFVVSMSMVWFKTKIPVTISREKNLRSSLLSDSVNTTSLPSPTSASVTEYGRIVC